MTPSPNAIETHALCKTYGGRPALDRANLLVPAGSLFGFLGPNGAGKTTTIRILMGLLHASGGRAEVLGGDAWHDGPRIRRDVGYLPGDVRFYERFTGHAVLDFLDQARGGGHAANARRLVRHFELDVSRRVYTYSRGMKQKLGLIQALMHRPKLLILDEPTTALDPLMREALFDELRGAVAEGRTVLFSSHTLAEVEALCDRVAIVRGGRLIEQERVSVLRSRAVRHVDVTFESETHIAPPAALRVIEQSATVLRGAWTGAMPVLLEWLARVPVHDVVIAPPSLEDLFMAYYAEDATARTPDPTETPR